MELPFWGTKNDNMKLEKHSSQERWFITLYHHYSIHGWLLQGLGSSFSPI
jgi:hypothetical protein